MEEFYAVCTCVVEAAQQSACAVVGIFATKQADEVLSQWSFGGGAADRDVLAMTVVRDEAILHIFYHLQGQPIDTRKVEVLDDITAVETDELCRDSRFALLLHLDVQSLEEE